MWRCKSCGEEIDDEFDACWKCGAGREGTRAADFRAEPNDPAVPDRGPDPPPPVESEEEQVLRERLVKLCSAANVLEADAICETLEEAGIPAKVVGEGPGVSAAGLPLGDEILPHVWVREHDAQRAREIVKQWRATERQEPAELPETEAPQGEGTVEAEAGPPVSETRWPFLSEAFYLVALLCLVGGALWAWKNWMALSTCSAATEGRLSDVHIGEMKVRPVPIERDVPPAPVAAESGVSYSFNIVYSYMVKEKEYHAYAKVAHAAEAPRRVVIYYDPNNPNTNIIGAIAPPWMIAVFAVLVAALLSFIGYQFR